MSRGRVSLGAGLLGWVGLDGWAVLSFRCNWNRGEGKAGRNIETTDEIHDHAGPL